ncbi:MAG: DUF493 family protein [Chitinivibrionales bacterium]|nr:DUF493 family protein [Chitinivibrionales bacterium]
MKKPEIEYPCNWSYRIVGQDKELMRKAVDTVVEDNKEFDLINSHTSSGGKYHSLILDIQVSDERERLHIFECLKKDPSVKFVL